MQFLIFHLDKDRYGLSTKRLIRVLPLLELKAMPGTPDYVAGLMNYQGEAVPVIDLCRLAYGSSCKPYFDTRILLVEHADKNGQCRMLGIVAERVAGISSIDENGFSRPGVAQNEAPYLGSVTTENNGILQLVDIDHLLPESVQAILFPAAQVST